MVVTTILRSACQVCHWSWWLGRGLIDCGLLVFRWGREMCYWSLRTHEIEPSMCSCGRREWKCLANHRLTGRRCVLGVIVSLMPHRYSSWVCQPVKPPRVLLRHFTKCSKFLQPRRRRNWIRARRHPDLRWNIPLACLGGWISKCLEILL